MITVRQADRQKNEGCGSASRLKRFCVHSAHRPICFSFIIHRSHTCYHPPQKASLCSSVALAEYFIKQWTHFKKPFHEHLQMNMFVTYVELKFGVVEVDGHS